MSKQTAKERRALAAAAEFEAQKLEYEQTVFRLLSWCWFVGDEA
ncbi:MAG TPA: hypothetical protein VG734_26180 [Lacunisphaera sp.]|nr:hypothetical protein [Lacunisphaera sp.]